MAQPRLSLIANPENRRAQFFSEACTRLRLCPPDVISWSDYLSDSQKTLPRGGILRVESPGENLAVEVLLSGRAGDDLPGAIRNQREWFGGWTQALRRLSRHLEHHSELHAMNAPDDICAMFDKVESTGRLMAAGIPLPGMLGQPQNFDEFLSQLDASGCNRAFIKLCHGSSASGVVAFERSGHRMQAVTSALMTRGSSVTLRNSLRLSRYQDPNEIRDLVDALGKENVIAERWFPKASIQGRVFDLRIVVIDGRASHVVVRSSRSPITNLHLGNRRGDLEAVRQRLGPDRWNEVLMIAERAASAFPRSLYLGVDLMVGSNWDAFAVAEVNAFGDLLPGLVDENGDDTYTAELRAMLRKV